MADERDNTGYGKPPKGSRFKPGQSGNPNGRPKFSSFKSELTAELNETIDLIDSNGKTVKLSKQRALIKMLMASALQNEKGSIAVLFASMKFFGIGFDERSVMETNEIEDLEMIKQFIARSEAQTAPVNVASDNHRSNNLIRKDDP